MTDHQQELYEMLLHFPRTEAAKRVQKRSPMGFVLQYGWWYDSCQVPEGIEQGAEQECYKNAQLLAHDRASLTYCEGFALAHSGALPVSHGWVTDSTGRAIDVTWPQPGIAYAGVPFRMSFISRICLKNDAFISVIDDWQNNFPLLNALGDNPEEWLEEGMGNGVARLNGDR
jgi:hypothetical protein